MDTTKELTHVSLCAGYGGIDLGLRRAIPSLRTVAFSEIEAFACANLVAKMEAGLLDAAPIWTDVKTFPWGAFRDRVDILSGGYPCQPFSAAGKRLGKEDPRHLWPWIANGIVSMRPRVCFFENVEGHISLGLSTVVSDLEEMGYEVSWGVFSASEVGAPHQRKRVFIMAHNDRNRLLGHVSGAEAKPNSDGEEDRVLGENGKLADILDSGPQGRLLGRPNPKREGFDGHSGCGRPSTLGRWPSRPGEPQHEWEPPRVVGNAESKQCSSRNPRGEPGSFSQSEQGKSRGRNFGSLWISNRQTQPSLGGDADGTTRGVDYAELCVSCDNRTDELRLLGNGVVPATAERAFLTLWNNNPASSLNNSDSGLSIITP